MYTGATCIFLLFIRISASSSVTFVACCLCGWSLPRVPEEVHSTLRFSFSNRRNSRDCSGSAVIRESVLKICF